MRGSSLGHKLYMSRFANRWIVTVPLPLYFSSAVLPLLSLSLPILTLSLPLTFSGRNCWRWRSSWGRRSSCWRCNMMCWNRWNYVGSIHCPWMMARIKPWGCCGAVWVALWNMICRVREYTVYFKSHARFWNKKKTEKLTVPENCTTAILAMTTTTILDNICNSTFN